MKKSQVSRPLGAAHTALFHQIYEALRDRIQQGELRPGDRLVEDRLAEDFGVSRNPVREAIRMLSADGLIDVNARRGVYIAVPDPAKIQELVEIRAVLEGHNARLAARRGNPKLLAAAGRILARGQAALNAEKFDSLGKLNVDFHKALARASENESLSEMLGAMRLKSSLGFAMNDPVVQAQSWQEHAGILQAILDGEEDTAETLSRSHVLRAGDRARERLEAAPPKS